MTRRFHQVDVFSAEPLRGNPLAVVHAAEGLDDARMAAIARWTHLSETTFLLPPTDAGADYRVRIFTPTGELPFAGHPTLGSCWAWLAAGGVARAADHVVQQCGIGLVTVKRDGRRLAFAAPPLRRTGPLAPELRRQIAAVLRIAESDIRDHQWVDNGPGWCAVLLGSGAQVRSLKPDFFALGDLKLGVVAPQTGGEDTAFEVRALFAGIGEDPVTGSLNAGLAQWLIGAGLAPERYVAAQGHALQRAGRVFVQREGDGRIWIGGEVTPVIEGIVRS
jgi:PhzF family phenazine biosynthesis protein